MTLLGKHIILAVALLSEPALAAGDIVMHRDPGCGCCEKWGHQVSQKFNRPVKIIDDDNRGVLQHRAGVPAVLSSCHTAIIDGMAFEGHVPIADMQRVLAARPQAVRGLAVAGMPMGSPGMEVPGTKPEPFTVMAFGSTGSKAFARHH